jgi:Phosphotyrosyl phosphate activator (PTPA) protein
MTDNTSNTGSTEDHAASTTAAPAALPPPRRCIYNDTDLQHFLSSSSKNALYYFTVAMGKSCASTTTGTTTTTFPQYDPSQPLKGLSPGIATLHGALSVMYQEWIYHDFPPTNTSNNHTSHRFGNPIFRQWHTQLQQRSRHIIATILHISYEYSKRMKTNDENNNNDCNINEEEAEYDIEVLLQAHEAGQNAARWSASTNEYDDLLYTSFSERDRAIVTELSYYLHDAFGHPIRLDYGTGHETSFHIFIFLLCQLRVFHNRGYTFHSDVTTESQPPTTTTRDNTSIPQPPPVLLPSMPRCKAIIISIYHQYLQVTRTLQTQYMFEPAGSHGVWGLDDYHCLPFYFGACQLIPEQSHDDIFVPSSIHNDQILQQYGDTYLYYGCIRFIKSIKKNVPFFESSPMLNDISHIATWYKISSGLIKLYEGEVLSKLPVVQHLIFGALFPATWTPSQKDETIAAPTEIFRMHTTTATTTPTTTVLPSHNTASPIVETRAPWAK